MKIKEEIRALVTWEQYPKNSLGGQQVGVPVQGSTLKCESLGFSVSTNTFKSQLKNRQLCWNLFELFLMETEEEEYYAEK